MESGQGAPMLPGGGGMSAFAQDAMRIDPLGMGMQFQPKPREPKFHNVNGHLVQEPTEPGGQARPVFTAPEKPKDWQNPDWVETQMKLRKAGAPNTNVNMPRPERSILKVDEERLNELSTAASSARRFAQTSSVINNLLKGAGGGGLIKLGTETAAYLGIKGDTIAANDLVESLNTRLATEVRAPGSGSTSNLEFEAYRTAAPSLRNSEQGRQLMAEVALRFAKRNAQLADYGRKLVRDGEFSDEKIIEYDEKLGSVLGPDLLKKLSAVAPSAASSNKPLVYDPVSRTFK
jgi:hypothetical protein